MYSEIQNPVRLSHFRPDSDVGEADSEHVSLQKCFVVDGIFSTLIPSPIAETLGLARMGQRCVPTPDGDFVWLPVVGPLSIAIDDRLVISDGVIWGDRFVLGQTDIRSMDLVLQEDHRMLIPNPKHPNGPVFRV